MTTQDGFYNEGHTTEFYLKQLGKLGCPADLLELAEEITAGQNINSNLTYENGDPCQQLFWNGSQLRIYEAGEWGFHRVHIEPECNGYVDFGLECVE